MIGRPYGSAGVVAASALLAAATVVLAAATVVLAVEPAGVLPCSHELPLTALRGLPTVPIRVGGSPPLDFVIDSGSELTAVTDLEIASTLDLHTRAGGWGTGMGGVRMPVLIAPDVALRGPVDTLFRTSLAVHAMGAPPDEAGALGFHGLLGSELFEHFVVEIDPSRARVLLHDPASYVYAGAGHVIPLRIDRRRPFVTARVTTAEGRTARLRLLVDTGSESQLALVRGSHRKLRVPEDHRQVVAVGVGGASEARIATVGRLEIATLSLEQVPTAFFHPHSLPSTRTFGKLQGILGNGLLGQFRSIVDYRRQRLILEPL